MTEILYFPSADACYLREFDGRIVERGPDHVVLDRTLFYAEGGGQPWDTGVLRWDGGEAKVHKVTKEKGVVKHYVDRMPERDEVHGIVDWGRRYAHMRYHTSQHLMSGVVWKIYGARTVGNQLYTDRARVDFQPANFTPEDLKRIEDECNRAIAEALPVTISEEDRVKIENEIGDRSLVDLIPKHITRLRVVKVGDRDYTPCGGTHLRTASEIGRVRILERRSKGKETDRITYVLESPQE
ncbi:MAG: alanyl-tRNA editing protein [Euryarchaeota archaeon]|nr:alanyl-tRNA editing protein [Euryarchaeota archaeon]